ncbi:GDSL-type esterase/lipase family protein [Brevundimonas sp.]|uniref:GDSL-type esterase/lipase family protein n=1 Tax=Brevundimonas sp. TaxID=1871086 RepID=UPI002AB97E42|nr:GDSL-type esterase/lipase family protein [Brevundimonas sp.]MDZ4365098.1 GDSL-type esterase/lipase family protein [Brevundimonas sp.]
MSSPQGSPTAPAHQYALGEDWLMQRYREIEADLNGGADLDQVRLVFIGDSITQFWQGWGGLTEVPPWDAAFGQRGSRNYGLNLGVAGDRTENTLLRLLPVAEGGFGHMDDPRLQPEIIVLMLGVNNVSRTDEPVVEKIVAGDLAVIHRLRQLRPNASILVQSILPTEIARDGPDIIEPVNRRLEAEVSAMGPNVTWLNLYPDFLGADGVLNPALFRDGYHLTLAGYQVWQSRLLPALEAMRVSPLA